MCVACDIVLAGKKHQAGGEAFGTSLSDYRNYIMGSLFMSVKSGTSSGNNEID